MQTHCAHSPLWVLLLLPSPPPPSPSKLSLQTLISHFSLFSHKNSLLKLQSTVDMYFTLEKTENLIPNQRNMHERQRLYISYIQRKHMLVRVGGEREKEMGKHIQHVSYYRARKMNQSCECMIHDDRAMLARKG